MIRKFVLGSMVAAAAFTFSLNAQDKDAAKNGYVGSEKCGMCHKAENKGKQLAIWKASAHANAFKTLQTEKADEIAKKQGLKTKAAEAPECLKCHASGYQADAVKDAKFKVEDGVQCETCHGAGSAYWPASVMKNKAEALKKGLVDNSDREKLCVRCHNSESPTFVGFKFDEFWGKIAHMAPKETK